MLTDARATPATGERLLTSKAVLYIGMTAVVLLLFGLKDVLILVNSDWPHLYAVAGNPVLSWEESYVYLPLANHFSLSTPLPAAPMADPTLSQFTNFPPITLVLQGVLLRWIFLGNVDAYLLAAHTLLPAAAFWLLFLIYRRYVAESWSLLLAFWGVTFFHNFSSLGYWLDIVGGSGFIEAASLSPLELTRTPTPSLSFLLFILTFYLATRDNKPTLRKMLLFSFLWALHLYIYLFNFIAGILFWFGYLVFARYLTDKAWRPFQIVHILALNGVVVLLVISPVLVNQLLLASSLDREIWQRMGMIVATAGPITSEWGVFLAYLLPLVVVLFVTWISFADYYELAYRFAPVFVMIVVEIVVLNLHLILGRFFQPYLFSVRIGNFFSRYLYFIPIIYFISQPRKRVTHRSGRLSHALYPLYDTLTAWVVRQQRLFALAGIALIAIPVVASSLKYANHHAVQTASQMALAAARFDSLTAIQPATSLVASEEIAVNLLLPVRSQHETLLVSAFNNYVPEAEILERLLLFAHIYNWNEQQFLNFMLPNSLYEGFYTQNDFILSAEVLHNGFGYWLLNHRREMDAAELAAYEVMLVERFARFDVRAAAAQYNLTAVQSSRPINPALSVATTIPAGDTTIYQLGGAEQ